jgi:hypothetical protein
MAEGEEKCADYGCGVRTETEKGEEPICEEKNK